MALYGAFLPNLSDLKEDIAQRVRDAGFDPEAYQSKPDSTVTETQQTVEPAARIKTEQAAPAAPVPTLANVFSGGAGGSVDGPSAIKSDPVELPVGGINQLASAFNQSNAIDTPTETPMKVPGSPAQPQTMAPPPAAPQPPVTPETAPEPPKPDDGQVYQPGPALDNIVPQYTGTGGSLADAFSPQQPEVVVSQPGGTPPPGRDPGQVLDDLTQGDVQSPDGDGNDDWLFASVEAVLQHLGDLRIFEQDITSLDNREDSYDMIYDALQQGAISPTQLPQSLREQVGFGKNEILGGIERGTIDPTTLTEEDYGKLGVTKEEVNRAFVDEQAVKDQFINAFSNSFAAGGALDKALEMAQDFFDWIVEVLDPTNIPGVGIKVNGNTGNIEFGVLNVPGLIFGTWNPNTGVFGRAGGPSTVIGGAGQGGSTPGTGAPGQSGGGGGGQQPGDVTDEPPEEETPTTGPNVGGPVIDTGEEQDGVDVVIPPPTTGDGGQTGQPQQPQQPPPPAVDDTEQEQPGVPVIPDETGGGPQQPPDETQDEEDDTTGVPPTTGGGTGDDNGSTGGGGTGTGGGGGVADGGGVSDIVSDILQGASAAASAAINISGIGEAADKQLQGTREGLALQEQMFERVRGGQEPFIDMGQRAITGTEQAANAAIDTGSVDVAGALPTATGGVQPQTTAGQQAIDIINSSNTLSNLRQVDDLQQGGELPQAQDAPDVAIPQEQVDPVTQAMNVVKGVDPFDPDSPVQQRLIDEAVRRVADYQAAGGSLGSSGARDAIAQAVSDAFIQGAQNIEAVNQSRSQRQLAAEQQEFSQVLAADDSNFSQSLALRQQLGAENRARFDQEALLQGIRFEQGKAVFDSQLQQRAQQLQEVLSTEGMEFEQALEYRSQLSGEDAQMFDMLMARDNQIFQQAQQNFTNLFNMDAQNFQQALNLDNQQFMKLLEVMQTGANVSVGAGSTAAQFAGAQSDLLAQQGTVGALESLGRTQAITQGLGELVDLFT